MLVFPICKINLGLHILNKREDGYHHLETVFYPLQLRDALEVLRKNNEPQPASNSPLTFTSSGLPIAGDPKNNLCIKAYHLLKKDFPSLPAVHMHLLKMIPMGAGLGGGSSDGAFALKMLNTEFKLGLTTQQLIDYALQLGSDCPFFIISKPCFATGRGELLEPIELDLSEYRFWIVNPCIHVNTGWAFEQLELKGSARHELPDLKHIIHQPITNWKEQLINHFEEPVFKAYPEIAIIKQQLYNAGALYASMTGSGSTVFGIFGKDEQPAFRFNNKYFVKKI